MLQTIHSSILQMKYLTNSRAIKSYINNNKLLYFNLYSVI